jgi:hypothetical protein
MSGRRVLMADSKYVDLRLEKFQGMIHEWKERWKPLIFPWLRRFPYMEETPNFSCHT